MKKPELLAPAGSIEAFFAGFEGGADAFYLGLRDFNARGRAKNFNIYQLQSLLKETDKHKKKVYLTLNTLIKNKELERLLDTLFIVSQTKLAAIIIQDWGVYYFVKKWFPQIKIHASTQMANHNSAGANFSHKLGFERIILARELTFAELENISKQAKIELEIFTHGSLCYSFSGMCYFSSYLGGMSANRGLCRQPCRRDFSQNDSTSYLFNLNDLQLIELLPQIMKLGICSLKIEGRMKPAEYVYQVVKAYRMAIDDVSKIPQAVEMLKFDFGREKTGYFMRKTMANSMNEQPYTGIFLGKVEAINKDSFSFTTNLPLQLKDRIRIIPSDGTDSAAFNISNIEISPKNKVTIQPKPEQLALQAPIFLVNRFVKRFKKKFTLDGKKVQQALPYSKKKQILSPFISEKPLSQRELFLRLDSPDWFSLIEADNFEKIILHFNESAWEKINWQASFLKKNRSKIMLQLPKFIPEGKIPFYKTLLHTAYEQHFSQVMLSHLSQKELTRHDWQFSASEQVYALNDAAIQFLNEQKIRYFIYPLENDIPNLLQGKSRSGIVPLFFYPELFYARTPLQADYQLPLQDKNQTYRLTRKNGINILLPEHPVCLFPQIDKLETHGFRRFLIDTSHCEVTKENWQLIMSNYLNQTAIPNKSEFNFKLGLR
jgi:U32 family peptidase